VTGEVRNVKVRLSVENAQAVAGVKQFGAATEQVANQVQRAGKSHAQAWATIERGSRNVAIGGAVALGVIEKASFTFDKQMSAVDAATHETARNMGLLREAAIKAGADTQFSATEAAAGITELAKAGVSTKAVLGGGLKGALDLAAAGQISVAESAETAASAMTQFQLKGKDVPHIADLLAAGAGKAQGSVHDLGMALNQSGLVASQTGLSIEDTTGTLAAFAKAGLTGSDAGTSFKTMLLSLNPRSKEAATLMKRYNIEAYDAQGNFVGITKYAGKLRQGLKGLTDQQRAAALQTIFGTDAIRAANILYRQGAPGIEKWIKKVNEQGYAADTAARQTDNLAGDVERFTGSLESAFIKAGSGGQQGLRDIVQTAEKAVDAFANLPNAVQSGIVKVLALTTATAGALYVAAKLRKAYVGVQTVLGLGKGSVASAAANTVAGGVQKVFVTNPGFGTDLPDSRTPKGTPKPSAPVAGFGSKFLSAVGVGTAIVGVAKLGQEAVKLADGYLKTSKAGDKVTTTQKSIRAELEKSNVGKYADDVHINLDKLAADMEKNGQKGKYFTKVMRDLEIHGLGENLNKTAGVLNPFGDTDTVKGNAVAIDLDKIAKASEGARRGTVGFKTGLDVLQGSMLQARAHTKEYRDLLDRLPAGVQTKVLTPGAVESSRDVERLARRYDLTPRQIKTLIQLVGGPEAIAEADKVESRLNRMQGKVITNYIQTITRGGDPKAPKGPTKQPAQNLPQLLAPKFALPSIDLSGYARQLKNIPAAVMTRISAPGATLSRQQALQLGQQYDMTPRQVQTLMRAAGVPKTKSDIRGVTADMNRLNGKKAEPKVGQKGAEAARAQVARLRAEIAGLKGKRIEIEYHRKVTGSAGVSNSAVHSGANSDRNGPGHATGGWTGPGAKYQPAGVVHADEFVFSKEATNGNVPMLDRLHKQLRGYADGGSVGVVTGGRAGDSVTVVFPSPKIYKAAVEAANEIAVSAAWTARSAADTRAAHLDDLHSAQRIRDLTADLRRWEKVEVRGKDGKDDDKSKKGMQDTKKTITRLAVRGLDRTVAYAELQDAKLARLEAQAAGRLEAIAELEAKRTETTATLSGAGDIFARSGAQGAITSVNRAIADVSTFGNTLARLKAAGASPALLAQVRAKGESGDFRSANKLGQALLSQPLLLGRLNASLSTLGSVSANVAQLTTDPRFTATAAWNPVPQAVSQVNVALGVDPSTWMTELVARTKYAVINEIAGHS
jgi:TP901 family phage tail tape measure protein